MNDSLEHDGPSSARHERELTLGTGTILGIFFGLVVLCGACFGVGYTMGRKPAPPPALSLNDTSADPSSPGNGAPKPAAGSPMGSSSPPPAVVIAPPAAEPTAESKPRPAPVVRRPPPPVPSDDAVASSSGSAAAPKVPAIKPVAPSALLPAASVSASPAAAGSIMVQVAAVSHREDADLLVSSLRGRGYTVAAHSSPADSLIHVQIGPFSNKPAAEAMRQRLQTDGYNAMLKF